MFVKTEIMSSLLRFERQQKLLKIHSEFAFFSFLFFFVFVFYLFGIKMTSTIIHSRRSLEKPTQFQTKKCSKSIPVFKPKRRTHTYTHAKTLPDGAAHTYIALCYKGVPPSSRGFKLLKATRKGFEVTPGHQTRDLSHRRHQGPRNNQLYQILAP